MCVLDALERYIYVDWEFGARTLQLANFSDNDIALPEPAQEMERAFIWPPGIPSHGLSDFRFVL